MLPRPNDRKIMDSGDALSAVSCFDFVPVRIDIPVSGANVVCPLVLNPVCAESGGEARIFPNGCLAEASNYAIIDGGSCEAERLAQTIYTKEYHPVCGARDGVHRPFGNECEARAAGFVVAAKRRMLIVSLPDPSGLASGDAT